MEPQTQVAAENQRHQRAPLRACKECVYCDKESVHIEGTGWQPNGEGCCTCQYSVVNGPVNWYQYIGDLSKPRQCAEYWQQARADELTLLVRGSYHNGHGWVRFEGEIILARGSQHKEYFVTRAHPVAAGDGDWRNAAPILSKAVGLAPDGSALGLEAQQVLAMLKENKWEYYFSTPEIELNILKPWITPL